MPPSITVKSLPPRYTKKAPAIFIVLTPTVRSARVTFGKQDNYFPQWSPDGKRVLFLRESNGVPNSICSISANGGKVTRLMPIVGHQEGDFRCYAWSPDGKAIAADFYDLGSSQVDYTLYLIDVATHKVRELPHTRSFAWSPDSTRLYLDRKEGDQILEVKTGKIVHITDEVDNPFWLDNQNLVGTFNTPNGSRRFLRVINARGKVRWSHPLVTTSKSNDLDDFEGGTFLDSITWHRMRTSSPLLLAGWQ